MILQNLNEHQIFSEDYQYNIFPQNIIKFPYKKNYQIKRIEKIILNIGFKNINYDKKKALSSLLALEILTNQKCILTSSRKTLLHLKIKKGDFVGCKVTLRRKYLFNFIDTLLLALSRGENFFGFRKKISTGKKNLSLTFFLNDLFIFYPLEAFYDKNLKNFTLNFVFNTNNWKEQLFLTSSLKIPVFIKQ